MSRLFGPITQNGYVVRDLDAAIKHWVETLGVGPFFVLPTITFESYRYKGMSSKPELRVALSNSGAHQIELIQQINDEPSSYRDFLRDHGPGLQHLSVWSTAYDADTERFVKHGLKPMQDGAMTGGIRFAYYDAGPQPHTGCVMEVLDAAFPHLQELFKMVRDAAAHWDGKDPIRHL